MKSSIQKIILEPLILYSTIETLLYIYIYILYYYDNLNNNEKEEKKREKKNLSSIINPLFLINIIASTT